MDIDEIALSGDAYSQQDTDIIKKLLLGTQYVAPNLSQYKSDFQYYNELIIKSLSISKDRQSHFEDLEELGTNYLVQLVIDIITDDVLTESDTGIVLDIQSDNPTYKKELDTFFKKFQIPDLIEDITPELLLYGEYGLKINTEPGVGIVDIRDELTPGSLLCLYESRMPAVFWIRNDREFKPAPIKDYCHFTINSRKIRLDTTYRPSEHSSDRKKKRSRREGSIKSPIFRVGRSIIWGGIDKIKNLELIEKLATANLVSTLTSQNLVGVGVPSSQNVNELTEICRKYETMLNQSSTSLHSKDRKFTEELIRNSTKIKVIPVFSEKGQLDRMDVNNDRKLDLLNQVKDDREAFLISVGVPVDLVINEVGNRRSALKQYARYSRKVKSVQRALIYGLKQISLNHLVHKFEDPEISSSDFNITMNNNINVDELDNLEGIELAIQGIKDVKNLVDDFSSEEDYVEHLDKSVLIKYARESLKTVGCKAFEVFKSLEEEEASTAPPATDDFEEV